MFFSPIVRKAMLGISTLMLLGATATMAQLSGTYTIAPSGGQYTSIANAITNLNSVGMSGPVVFELAATYAGETYPIALPAIASASATNTITIRPAAGVLAPLSMVGGANQVLSITGNYYKIDGRPGGTGSSIKLNISSTVINKPTVHITGTANYCHIKYCNITGCNALTGTSNLGIVYIGGNTGGGTDNDTISYCKVSSGATAAACGIGMGGSNTANSSDNGAIMHCDVYDIIGSSATAMIYCNSHSINACVFGNSVYNTSAKTSNVTSMMYGILAQGSSIIVSGNYIGGSQAYCGGSYTVYDGASSKTFYGINVSNTNCTVSGNKISNIKLEGRGTFSGIYSTIANTFINGNTIGGETGVDSIVFLKNASGNVTLHGIFLRNSGTITGNKIGALKTDIGPGGSGTSTLYGILHENAAAATISNNLVGSVTTANSIHQADTSSGKVYGIRTSSASSIITGNTIANILNSGTISDETIGIYASATTITGNLIRNLSNSGSASSGTEVLCGINVTGSVTPSNNKIYALKNYATTSGSVYGMYGGAGSGNLIYGLSSIAPTATITGIHLTTSCPGVSNNMIRLGIDEAGAALTAGHTIYGIRELGSLVCNIYHNSVYIGGTGVTGSANSYCFNTTYNVTRSIQNNIFVNARVNGSGTGKHYNIALGTSATSISLSHNLYYNTYGSFLGSFNNADQTSLADWQTAIGKDADDIYEVPLFVNPMGGTASLDLHLKEGTSAEGAGTPIAAVTTDYDGETRSTLSPTDIGADAGDFGIIWTGTTSNDWNTATNWKYNAAPTALQTAVIPPTVVRDPQLAGNTTVANLTIYSGRTLTITAGNTLNVTNKLFNSGTVDGLGTVALTGSSAQSIKGSGTINNLTLNNAAGATIATDALVNLTGAYTPAAGVLTTNGKLTLKSSAAGDGRIAQGSTGGSYISGDVTVERYVPGGRRAYRFFGHPFSAAIQLSQFSDDVAVTGAGGATNGFYTTHTNNASAYYYDPTQGTTGSNDRGWQPFTSANANSWDPHEGIRVLVRGAGDEGIWVNDYTPSPVTIDWSGPLNQGAQTINLTKGASSGYNIMGNPFASPVIPGPALAAAGNMDGAGYWVWDPMQQGKNGKGAYLPYVISPLATDAIPSGSAISVKVLANTTVTIAESAKASSSNVNAFRTTAMPGMVQLHVYDTNGAYYDRIYVRDNAQASDSLEQQDGMKMNNPNTNFYVWSADNNKLSVDTRAFAHGKLIPLGFTSVEQQQYVIEVMQNGLAAGSQLALHDKYLNTVTPLDMGVRYRFAVTGDTLSQGDNRFELGVTVMAPPVTSVKEVAKTMLQVNCVPNPATSYIDLSIMSSEVANTTVSIYDISGSIAYRQVLGDVKDRVARISLQELAAGMYIISVQHGKEVVTGRVIKQ
jgi:putative cofactor-binding repeat protein